MNMGKWRIVIEGTGLINNGDDGKDSDKIAKDTVALLKVKTHTISNAKFEILDKKVEDINL